MLLTWRECACGNTVDKYFGTAFVILDTKESQHGKGEREKLINEEKGGRNYVHTYVNMYGENLENRKEI